jgi:integrase/recombinase XerD
MQRAIKEYIEYGKKRSLRKTTLAENKKRLIRFYEFIVINYPDVKEITDISKEMVKSYEKYLLIKTDARGKPFSTDRRSRLVATVRSFFNFLEREELIYKNPAATVVTPRKRETIIKDVLTVEEMQKLIKACKGDTIKSIRDRAILEVLYSTALRADELCGIELNDIDFEEKTLFVRKPKMGIERIVPLGQSAVIWSKIYLKKVRPIISGHSNNEYFFVTLKGKRFGNYSINFIVKEYAEVAKLDKNVTTHTFRHSCALHMLKSGADIRFVQKHLGHKSIASTEKYLKIEISDLKEVHARTHPREVEDWGI